MSDPASDVLRHAVSEFFEALRPAEHEIPWPPPTFQGLQTLAGQAKKGTRWGKHACRQLEVLGHASLIVRRLKDDPVIEQRDSPWTIELDVTGISAIVGWMSIPRPLDEIYLDLYRFVNRARRYFRAGDRESEQFYLWLRGQYQAWDEIAENCSRGRECPVPYEKLSLPYFFPWLRFDGRVLAGVVGNVLRRGMGPDASMLTIIEDGKLTPIIFYEHISDGVFHCRRLYKGETPEQVRLFVEAEERPISYVKRATIECLRGIYAADRQFALDGDRAKHTATVLKWFVSNRPTPETGAESGKLDGLSREQQQAAQREVVIDQHAGRNPHLIIEPMPHVLMGVLSALDGIEMRRPERSALADSADESEQQEEEEAVWGLPLTSLLPNIWIRTPEGTLQVDLQSRANVTISEALLLEIADVLSNVRSLHDATDQLARVVAREMPYGGLSLDAPGIAGGVLRAGMRPFRREAPALLRTLRWTLSLLGSPLRFVLQSGSTGVLVGVLDGSLSRIVLMEMSPERPLPEAWVKLCQDKSIGFVHFLFRLETQHPLAGVGVAPRDRSDRVPAIIIGPGRRLQYYPDNAIGAELARHFRGLGIVNALDLLPDLFAASEPAEHA